MNEEEKTLKLKELEKAEAEVLELVALTEGTVDELKRVPEINPNLVGELSQGYLRNIKSVQATLKKHASVFDEKQDNKVNNLMKEATNGGFQQQYMFSPGADDTKSNANGS